MKSTGIIRRIDDLGRIVIPKEIRKNLRIKEGENLEICIDNNENIVLKKYSLMSKINSVAQDFTDTIYNIIKHNIFILDNDYIIAATGNLKKEYLNEEISENMENSIKRRETLFEKHIKEISIKKDTSLMGTYIINTIIVNGDAVGLVIIFDEKGEITEFDKKIAEIVATFLSKYLEQ